jgi:rod shape-determining protein MreC
MRFIYTRAFSIGFAIFVGVALLVILDLKGYISIVKDSIVKAYGYTSQVGTNGVTGTKNLFSTFFTIRKLVYDNAELEQKIDDLSFDNARLQTSKEENLTLRKALNFKQQSTLNLLPTEVVSLDPTGFKQVITIDKGQSNGVRLNSAVVAAPGLLVGKVTKVDNNSAEVTLITDPSIVINAEVTDTGAHGLIQGEHGLGLSFDLISQSEVIKTEDKVVTSSVSGDYPSGLLIGQIDSIKSSGSDLFQKAFVAPAADLRNLKFLFVVMQ